MLKIIEPQDYACYRGRVDFLMELMQLQNGFSLSGQERTRSSFIVDQGENGQIYGGAVFQQQSTHDLPPQLEDVLTLLTPHIQHVWVATLWRSIVDPKERSFYGPLLKKLFEFGKEKDLRFLCLAISVTELAYIKQKEGWPFVLEVSDILQKDSDFVYCVLSFQKPEKTIETPSVKTPLSTPLPNRSLAA